MRSTSLILAPVDFSPGGDSAAAYAYWLAGRLGAKLRLVHAVGGGQLAGSGAPPAVYEELRSARAEARRQAERDLADLGGRLARTAEGAAGPQTETAVVDAGGVPSEAIVAAAREAGADLIVMATHGRSGVRRMLLGSVAEHVIRAADCPVLTMK